MSVLQEANVLLLCQSTSNAGAKRKTKVFETMVCIMQEFDLQI